MVLRLRQSKITRLVYVLLILLLTLIGIFMITPEVAGRFHHLFCSHNYYYFCDLVTGYDAVYRIGFGLATWFLLMALITFGVTTSNTADNKRAKIQNNCWFFKIFTIVIIESLFILIPHTDFNGEIWIFFGLNGAFSFMILQYLFILDAANMFNIYSKNIIRQLSGTKPQMMRLLKYGKTSSVIILYGVYFLSLLEFYRTFVTPVSKCFDNLIFLIFHIIMTLGASMISMLPVVHNVSPQSGLFPCAITSLYCTYLIWLAFSNEPNTTCNPLEVSRYPSPPLENIQIIITMVITFATLVLICLRDCSAPYFGKAVKNRARTTSTCDCSEKHEGKCCLDDNSLVGNPFALSLDHSASSSTDTIMEVVSDELRTENKTLVIWDDEQDGVEYSYSFFHFTFSLATISLVMSITCWYRLDEGEHLTVRLIQSWSPVWLRISAGVFCSFIYIWSLVVPILFPDTYNELLFFQYMPSLPMSH